MFKEVREGQRVWRALGDRDTGRSERAERKAGGRPPIVPQTPIEKVWDLFWRNT